jgi:tRNA(Ile)-lysidine synthase
MANKHASSADLLAAVQQALSIDCRLDARLPLLVGVSGGPDSLCLLHVLSRLGWQVTAAHFDHQLRPESGQDAARVAQMAAAVGAGFIDGSEDVGAFAQRGGLSVEEAARTARYHFLFTAARQIGAQAVAVGHTSDDQVETVLMHLLRGAGLAGLRGMSLSSLQEGWDAAIPLVRPLLQVGRTATVAYCAENSLEALHDPSNKDTLFFRNRLRHELIPTLESYNPQFRQVLLRTADVLRGEYALVEAAVETAWQGCLRASGVGYLGFERSRLETMSEGLLRGVLRRAVGQLRPGLRDIGFEDIERAAAFATNPSRSGEMDLTAGLRLFVEEGLLYIEEPGASPLPARWPQLVGGSPLWLDLPGEVELANGWRLRAARCSAEEIEAGSASQDEAWLDAEGLVFPLVVRAAIPGERFAPLGMQGQRQKLSDLWINQGVPRRARANWPLVCTQAGPLWVVGLRAGHQQHVTPASRSLVHLKLYKPPAE